MGTAGNSIVSIGNSRTFKALGSDSYKEILLLHI